MLPKIATQAWSAMAILFLLWIVPQSVEAQCSANIDFNTWTVEGPPANGNWNVNAPGTSVTQTINGLPTFFVSPEEFINVRITGTISTSGGDDDYIGFVFGYRNPISQPGPNYPMQTMLFDWKQGNQGTATEGRYLVQMDTTFALGNNGSISPFFWEKQSTPAHNLLSSTTGPGTGWNQNVNYNFELTYLADRTVIVVNNDTFFDVNGCFLPGRFGFYNYSQNPVVYSNFSYTLLPDFTFASANVCLTDSARFIYSVDTCSSVLVTNSEVASWKWDFGDGNIDSVPNPTHLYGATGVYNVQLVITDSLGCQDSLTQPITILSVPTTPTTSNNTPICEGAPIVLNSVAGPGVTYNWTGPNGYFSTTANPVINPTTVADSGNYVLTVSDGNCNSEPDTTLAVVLPEPAAPVASSNSPVCEDSLLSFSTTTVAGATYTWTGPNGFSSNLGSPFVATPSVAASGNYNVFATINGCPGPVTTLAVTVNPTPVVDILGDTTICIGDGTTLTGTGASTYAWNTSATTTSIAVAPVTTTTFSVTGTSAAGCPAPVESATVVVSPLPVVSLGPDLVVCDTVTLNAGPGFLNYNWNTPATTQSILVTTSGQYIVEVMGTDSCLASDTINVTVNTTPTALITGDSTICPGTSTTLTASGGATFNWNNGATTAAITVSPPADSVYLVTTTSNGCTSAPDSITVLVGAAASINLGPDLTVCDDTILDAGPGFVDYFWNTSATTQSISVSTTGIYGLVVMNADSCFASDSLNVTVNVTELVDLGVDQTICNGDQTTFTAAPGTFATYQWTPPVGSGASVTVGTPGNYIVNTVDVNGCPDADTVNLANFPVLNGDIGPDSTICDGTTITLDASSWGGATYAWAPGGQATASIPVSAAGTYTVTIDDGNGCIYTDTRTISVDVPPVISVSNSATTTCENLPIVFTASPTGLAQYQFSQNGTLASSGSSEVWSTIGLSNGDVITVLGITAAGCPTNVVTADPVTLLPLPTGTISAPDVCDGETTQLEVIGLGAGVTATWNGTGGLSGAGPNIGYVYPGPGTYQANVVLDNGFCSATLTSVTNVRNRPPAPFVPNAAACEGSDLEFNASGIGSLSWFDAPTGGTLLGTGPFLVYPNAPVGLDTLYIETFSNNCFSDRHAFTVDIGIVPTADFISNPDTNSPLNVPEAQVTFVNLSTNADNYLWNFGDGNFTSEFAPVHNYFEEGLYTVTLIASTNANCADTVSREFYRVTNIQQVLVPNAFTPNGDNLNDVFEIVPFGVPTYEIEIFDRWGKFIFANQGDASDFWDGTFSGQPVVEGVYVYRLRFANPDGTTEEQSGTVTVYR